MLSALVRQSLRHPWLVLLGAVVLLALGVTTLRSAAYDVFPEFVPPQASVQTEAPGLSPQQVEMLVTRPLEAVINGANGVETVRSQSIQGLSVIDITFREGNDAYRARQQVSEALADAIPRLPPGVDTPRLTPLVSSTMDLLKIGLVSQRLSPMQLRDLAEWTIKPRLLSVPGVARANVFGGEQRRIEVRADPARLLARGITFADLGQAVSAAVNVNGGGFADTPNQRILVDPGPSATTGAQIAAAVLTTGPGGTVRIGDVAQVADAAAPPVGDALIMGKPGVLMTLSSQYGANTLDTTRALERAINDIAPALRAQGVTLYPALHRPANFVEVALSGITVDLAIGAVMVFVVLLVFLRDVRVVMIAFVSIPLSLLAALIVLDRTGQTINTMTLGGLAVALGVVIDDAIVDIENIVRRLRGVTDEADRRAIIAAASIEVRAPVVHATFVLALTMLPVILLTGLQGAFFAPLGLAFLLATMASLVVALSVTPALALMLLRGRNPVAEPALLERFKNWHEGLMRRLCARPGVAAGAIATLGALALVGTLSFGSELLPTFREQHYVLQVSGPPGASLAWMRSTGEELSRRLLAIPEVLSVEEQIGRAEAGEDTWPPSQGEFHLRLKSVGGRGEDTALAEIRAALAATPALQGEVTTFLGDRISESLSGETAAIAISVQGADLDTLDRTGATIAAALRSVPGATDVTMKAAPGTPMLGVTLDPARMALHGVTAADAGDAIRATFAGQTVGQVVLADRAIDVAVTLPPDLRRDPEALGDTLVRASAGGASGGAVRLADIATISPGEARALIAHEGGLRRQIVTANVVPGHAVADVVKAAQARIARDVALPPGVFLSWAGTAEGAAAAQRQLLAHVALAGVAMVALLILAFGGVRPALLILAGMPPAMAGGVLAVALTGGVVSLGALVGFIALFGISARNAILLVAHVDQLVLGEGRPWTLDTLLEATRERVTPILLTALVTAFALLPVAIETGQSGREIQGPMAVVILGGLATSLLLTLLLLPALVWRWRFSAVTPAPMAD
ncbi:acriflavine resistance protein B [Novosphingobium sp. AAP1]|uniref:efflux RND transporter permease subunit n=1 Tax=Novosphingobium sp. AAP1 TaxID=1523413 RepID=UPI0006B9960A|nr:efflux RND transporter permease subunit [Novosphingobium sp. AAP1]KPF54586.1 acriflavine resistance protein B [Novosphingobium sp. AAP1]